MANTEDSREKKLAYDRAWRAANRTKIIALKRAWRAANPEKQREITRKQHVKERTEYPERHAYNNHRSSAKRRGIAFLLTFEEWLAIWFESGKFAQRGIHRDEYCMARHGDVGPYAVGNVQISANLMNKREANRLRRGKPLSANRLAALARARAIKMAKAQHSNDAPLS